MEEEEPWTLEQEKLFETALACEEEEPWTLEQEKLFETALACEEEDEDGDDDDDPDADFWERIAARVPGKNASQVEAHYGLLIQDVDAIDSGLIRLPPYPLLPAGTGYDPDPLLGSDDGAPVAKKGEPGSGKGYSKSAHQERRKGIPWSEEEHRLFLLGLDKFGKGDWRSISRNYVITRTPTQVASHAQKYFIRLNSMNRDRRRSSIHDITSVNNGEASQTSQGPITGQGAVVVGQASTSHSITAGAPPPPLPVFPNGAMYGGAPTLGTPILPPPPGVNGPYMAGGPPILRSPPGAPMAAVMQVSYPMSQPMVQR